MPAVVFGSLRRADSGDTRMSVSGGAFLQFHANAMTDQTTSASVSGGRGQVAGCVPCVRMPVLQLAGRSLLRALSVLIGSISPLMWGLPQWVRTVRLSRLCLVWVALLVSTTKQTA